MYISVKLDLRYHHVFEVFLRQKSSYGTSFLITIDLFILCKINLREKNFYV